MSKKPDTIGYHKRTMSVKEYIVHTIGDHTHKHIEENQKNRGE